MRLSKKEGELGVRDISLFNKALVGKWGLETIEGEKLLSLSYPIMGTP